MEIKENNMQPCTEHKRCEDDALLRAEEICQRKGLRFTELRRKVLAIIWENNGPAKAYDILDKLKENDASAKPPTVYRTLDFLLKNGLVHKLSSINAYVGCSHPQQHNDCYFLICYRCKEIEECCNSGLSQIIANTVNINKFSPNHVTLEIQGECQKCKAAPPSTPTTT
jgi:Fur family zinc uptake transcriptional regulator